MARKATVVLLLILLALPVGAALAGGWAVVSLDNPPGEIHAGQPWTMGFTVLQHGQTPVHRLDATTPVEPLLVATNTADGRRVEVDAQPTEEVGHFVVEVTFPSDGTWEWIIYPNPLGGDTLFEPLTVLPATAATTDEAAAQPAAQIAAPAAQPVAELAPAGTLQTGLRWAAVATLLLAVGLLVAGSRRRAGQGVKS